jgi:hypothetical protein
MVSLRKPNTAGIVLCVAAIGAAVLSLPFLAIPLMKIGFLALVGLGPLAVLVFVAVVVLVNVLPLVGLVVAFAGSPRAGWFSPVAGGISLTSAISCIALVQLIGPPLADPKPVASVRGTCKPTVLDTSASGRHCEASDDGGLARGDCPEGYRCEIPVVGGDRGPVCQILCLQACACAPPLDRCVNATCVRPGTIAP